MKKKFNKKCKFASFEDQSGTWLEITYLGAR